MRVSVEVAPDLPAAKADSNQLEMALLNLGVNARDAMPEGGSLRISATRELVSRSREDLKGGDYVRLSVADTGVGMDEATRLRAIEPFFSTKGVGKGTGLGLSMVHGLAAQLGGALTIQSRRGIGTNVELWLPVDLTLVLEIAAPAAEAVSSSARGLALLVDDEEVVRTSTADMLEELGFEVRQAVSGEAALALVAGGTRPDLLVTDHLMPGMTGVDLARAVQGRMPGLPVLIVSGYAEAEGVAPDCRGSTSRSEAPSWQRVSPRCSSAPGECCQRTARGGEWDAPLLRRAPLRPDAFYRKLLGQIAVRHMCATGELSKPSPRGNA